MIRALRNLPLGRKLVGANVAVSMLVLGLALAALLVVDAASYRRALSNNLSSVGRVIANSNTATLVFGDVDAAQKTLETLRDSSEVASVFILDAEGDVFAMYINSQVDDDIRAQLLALMPKLSEQDPGAAGGSVPPLDRRSGLLRVDQPIILGQETVGSVAIFGDMRQLDERREWYFLTAGAVLAVFALVAFGLATVFQRIITKPISGLVANMRAVTERGDYAIRAERGNKDEVGTLISGFNDMLDYIQSQNAALASHGARLEEEVAARTADLTGAKAQLEQTVEQLKEAKDAAEAANSAKSDFLAKMSHEIRTPVNGVLGTLELLADAELTSQQRVFVATAARSGERLLQIVDDVLDVSKIEAGQLQLEAVEFGLRDTIEQTVELFAQPAHQKSLELMCWIEPMVPERAVGDEGRLRQVLTNLLSNAIKFTDKGQVVVRVSRPRNDPLTIEFEVHDTGIGVPAERQANLFDAFRQADDSVTRRYGGTGLGLAIAKQLVEAMGGTIGIRSEGGAGATFRFTTRMGAASGREEPQIPPAAFVGARALVVEDNPTHAEMLRRRLTAWDFECDTVGSAVAAIQRLAEVTSVGERPFDVVISDAELPGMGGFELARRIEAEVAMGSPAVVLLRSSTSGAPERNAARDSVAGCLAKPIRESELWRVLCDALGGVCPHRAVVDPTTAPSAAVPSRPAPLGLRVLLAEDNAANVMVASAMLEELGCLVEVARDGNEAIDLIERDRFDAVLMDCQMPHLDGYEATRRIRALESESGRGPIPILALTAHAVLGDRERCLDAGMDDYMTKPIRMATLRTSLEKWCGVASGIGAGDDPPRREAGTPIGSDEGVGDTPPDDTDIDSRPLDQLRALGRTKGGRRDVVTEVIEAYLDACPELLGRIRAAVGRGDDRELRDAAHALKSSSLNVGAAGLASLCAELENRAGARSGTHDERLIPRIEAAFTGTRRKLNTVLTGTNP